MINKQNQQNMYITSISETQTNHHTKQQPNPAPCPQQKSCNHNVLASLFSSSVDFIILASKSPILSSKRDASPSNLRWHNNCLCGWRVGRVGRVGPG